MKKLSMFITVFLVSILLTACTKNVENQKLTLKFDFGSREGTYTGEMKNDLPNGNGRFDTKNKEGVKWYYDGEWVDGTMEGQGMQCWEELEQKDEGTYKNNHLINGKSYTHGLLKYEGDLKDDRYNGQGKLYGVNKEIIYEGKFVNGKPKDMEKFKEKCNTIPYKKIAKKEKDYFNEPVKFSGEVVQVEEGEDNTATYRVSLDEFAEEVVMGSYTRGKDEERILEGEKVTLYGTSDGLYTYESVLGQNITIPYINILSIEVD